MTTFFVSSPLTDSQVEELKENLGNEKFVYNGSSDFPCLRIENEENVDKTRSLLNSFGAVIMKEEIYA